MCVCVCVCVCVCRRDQEEGHGKIILKTKIIKKIKVSSIFEDVEVNIKIIGRKTKVVSERFMGLEVS